MKVGIVSSFGECCGIAEYTKSLVEGIQNVDIKKSIDIKVVANYPKDKLYPEEDFVKRLFHCPFMTNKTTADVAEMVNYLSDRDLVHIQFETSLYHPSWFPNFIKGLEEKNIKTILTMHSSGMWPSFNIKRIDHIISHSRMWCSDSVWPMGIRFFLQYSSPDYKSIVSFGLGRNRDDFIKESIKDTDVSFRTHYGNHKWVPLKELVKEIQKSWIISLIYPSVGNTEVSSSAVTLAMGCGRPILISDTNWFSTVRGYPSIFVCSDVEQTREIIKSLTDPENVDFIKDEVKLMKESIKEEGRSYQEFVWKHIDLYKKVVKS